jgi:hypothetical protein
MHIKLQKKALPNRTWLLPSVQTHNFPHSMSYDKKAALDNKRKNRKQKSLNSLLGISSIKFK